MIEVRHLSTPLRDQESPLNDISFHLGRGEVVAIIGRNHSGKSLLCQTIADVDQQFSGDIIVNHFQARHEPEKVKQQIGYASASLVEEKYLTGFEFLDLIGSFYHLSLENRRTRILELGRRFGCLEQLYSLLERQSSAVRQKIGLIASLLAEPQVLIWDEPTLFLDHFGQLAVAKEIKHLAENSGSILLATNDLGFAQNAADRFLVMDQGQCITEGTLSQLQHLTNLHKQDLTAIFEHLVTHE